MKKLVSVMLTLVLCLSCLAFTGCTEEVDDGKYKIGIVQLVEHVALDAATEGFKQAIIDELGADKVDFEILDKLALHLLFFCNLFVLLRLNYPFRLSPLFMLSYSIVRISINPVASNISIIIVFTFLIIIVPLTAFIFF